MNLQQIVANLDYVQINGLTFFTLDQLQVDTWMLNDTHGIELWYDELRWGMDDPDLRRSLTYKVVGHFYDDTWYVSLLVVDYWAEVKQLLLENKAVLPDTVF
jgi:hypothetical protein